MTEYNLFCYSKKYDVNSFQQERYRVFNKVVDEKRYYEILRKVQKIIPNSDKLKLNDFWKSISQKQWNELLSIPEAKDFKEGFEYISGIKLNISNCDGREIKIDGNTYTLSLKEKI